MLEYPTIIVCDNKERFNMDANEMKGRILALSEEIEEILVGAGNPKTWSGDYGAEVADVIFHLGYIDSVVREWGGQ